MDPLSTTASVIAVVTAALQCAKTIREIVCGIRDGPTHIAELGTKMSDIRDLLKQLKAVGQRITGNEFDDLKATMQRCASDLATFERKILKVREVPGEKKWAKVKKRIKATLKEDDFLSMGRKVAQYIETIGVQLEIVGTGTRLDHGNAISVVGGEVAKVNNQLLDHSRRTNSAISVQTDTLHTIRDDLQDSMKMSETNWNQSHLEHRQTISVLHRQSDYMQSTDQRIKDISDDASSRWEESLSFQQVTKMALERQTSKLDAMGASSRTQSNRSDAHHQATVQGVASVNDKLANLSNLSLEQFSVIIRMLQQIESAQTTTGEKATTEATGNNDNGDGKKELSETIDRLCLLAEEDGTVHSSDAQSIIEDLEHVLDVLSDFTSSSKEDQRKRKRSDNDGNEITLPDVKRMRGLLTSASAVALNPKAYPRLSLAAGARYRDQTRYTTLENDGCNLSLLVRHRYCRKSDTDNNDGEEGLEELITGSVTCMPISSESRGNAGPMHRLQVRATFLQKIKNGGSFSLFPTLAFSAVLPVDSEAFICAESGDLQGLMRLLNEGKASLWDCDTQGRQLLHYACQDLQLAMCKFLLQNGANPDCLAINSGGNYTPPICHGYDAFADTKVELTNSQPLEFQRLLIDAGADPTLSVGGAESSLNLELKVNDNLSMGLLQILLDHGGHFVQLNDSIDGCGNTPLMLLVWNISKYEWSPISTSKVALLLERGASPWVSNHHGNTVLHIVLENYSQNPTNAPYSRERYNVLMAVIGAGADVTARNLAGYTVSDYAYMWNRGAEWEDALRASGHDQSEVCGVSNQQPKAERKGSILEKKCTVIFGSRRYRMCQVCQQTDVSIEIVEEEV